MKSITEKAKELGCDKETVRQKCLKCELPCAKVGTTYVVFEPGEKVYTYAVNGSHGVITTQQSPKDGENY